MFSIVFSILKEWRMIGLLKWCMWEWLGSHLVGSERKNWTDSVNDCLKKRSCWASKKDGV